MRQIVAYVQKCVYVDVYVYNLPSFQNVSKMHLCLYFEKTGLLKVMAHRRTKDLFVSHFVGIKKNSSDNKNPSFKSILKVEQEDSR